MGESEKRDDQREDDESRGGDRGDRRTSEPPQWEWETDGASDAEREVVGEASFEAEGWEDIPADPEDASRLLRALQGMMPDVLKRTLSAGVEGLASGEERIRSTLSEGELPKEAIGMLLRYADLTKRELLRLISREIRHFLEDMDFGGEIAKILTSLSLEARMQVRFIPNEDAVRPNASGDVTVKQSKSSGRSEDDGDNASQPGADEKEESAEAAPGEWTTRWRERWDRATEAVGGGEQQTPWERFRRPKEDDEAEETDREA